MAHGVISLDSDKEEVSFDLDRRYVRRKSVRAGRAGRVDVGCR